MPLLLSSEIHRRAHEIALAELDPAMAQDVIRRCTVEIEGRFLQQPLAKPTKTKTEADRSNVEPRSSYPQIRSSTEGVFGLRLDQTPRSLRDALKELLNKLFA